MFGHIIRLGALVLPLMLLPLSAAAQDNSVVLESFDGSIRLTGELKDFNGSEYILTTAIGEVTIQVGDVRCEGAACPDLVSEETEFLISGSRGLATGLLPALVDGYSFVVDADLTMAAETDGIGAMTLADADGVELASIQLATGGSSSGMRDLAGGTASLALTTRPAREAEVAAVAQAGFGDISSPPFENVLALDGLLVITSRDNPVRALTEQNIARIFSGAITNWADVGGPNAPINLYARGEDTGTGAVFFNLVMRGERVRVSQEARLMDSDAAVSDAVASDPNGIGFTSFSNERNAKSLAIQGVCGIQTPPNSFTIKTEEYPLTRRLYVYRPDRPIPGIATEFLAYLASDDAQDVIAETGFVDQGISALSANNMGLRFISAVLPSDAESTLDQLQGMMRDLIAADRLSLTFRFETGSSVLDSRAQADILRLAELIDEGEFANKEILLIGFTDSVGRADINQTLSGQRAGQVRDALLAQVGASAAGGANILTLGYGEMSPLGCNETANGRRINRRVEVWTRDIIQ